MKKILIIAFSYPPNGSSGTFRILHFANYLSLNGIFKPHILTVDPEYYEADTLIDKTLFENVRPEVIIHATRYVSLRGTITSGFSFRRRKRTDSMKVCLENDDGNSGIVPKHVLPAMKDFITDEALSFPDRKSGWLPFAVAKGIKIIKQYKIDIIMATGGPWTSFCIGSILKRITGIPLVLDYRDPWNDNPFNPTNVSWLYQNLSHKLEKHIVRTANSVILNTRSLRDIFIKKYGETNKFYYIPNGYLEEDIIRVKNDSPPANNERFVFIHAGDLYGFRKIDEFLSAFKKMIEIGLINKKAPLLKLVGIGPESEVICKTILGEEVFHNYCCLLGRISHKECIEMMGEANCLVLFQQGTSVQVPRKLFEYLALKKPILAITPKAGETGRIIDFNRAGIVVSDDRNEIYGAMQDIYKNYDYHQKRLMQGTKEHEFRVSKLASKLENILDIAL